MNQLDDFETRLLAELRTVVEEQNAGHAHPPARRGTWLLVAAAAAIIAAAVVIVPIWNAAPAWAVTREGNGRVDVQVNRIEDAAGLERALAAEGIVADVTYLPAGDQCAPGRYRGLESPDLSVAISSDRSFRITVPPGAVPNGAVLVIAASWVPLPDAERNDGTSETNGFRTWVDVGVATAPPGPCVVVPAQ